MAAVRYGVVGAGWRAGFFVRLAAALPDDVELVGVVARSPEAAARLRNALDADTVPTLDDLLTRRPQFVVSCVSKQAAPGLIGDLVGRGLPVLAETPPAPDADALRALWSRVGASGLVQVAEQYLLMPGHAARLELVRRGLLGAPTSVQVSSTHGYHAVSMIRGLLGGGFEPATVTARRFAAPLVDPIDRAGWRDDPAPRPATTTLATIDFGGTAGLYDFTDNQWHNPLRTRRIVVRGSHGELVDDTLTRQTGPRTIVTSALVRQQSGYDLDLTGYDTGHLSFEGEVVWRNPLPGHRLADEEIAIAALLAGTAAWVRDDGPAPYPLAQACQDQLIALAVDAAAATGRDVRTGREAWADRPG